MCVTGAPGPVWFGSHGQFQSTARHQLLMCEPGSIERFPIELRPLDKFIYCRVIMCNDREVFTLGQVDGDPAKYGASDGVLRQAWR